MFAERPKEDFHPSIKMHRIWNSQLIRPSRINSVGASKATFFLSLEAHRTQKNEHEEGEGSGNRRPQHP